MRYAIEGKLLEACSCAAVCPCWVGDDPDGGKCDGLIAYHYDRGEIDGVNVAGLTLALAVHIPGNVLKGGWKVVAFVDSAATPRQKEAILAAHTGRLGGPLADLAPSSARCWASTTRPSTSPWPRGGGTSAWGTR